MFVQGTLRSYLDPFNQYSDVEIFATIEKCGLDSLFSNMPKLRAQSADSSDGSVLFDDTQGQSSNYSTM